MSDDIQAQIDQIAHGPVAPDKINMIQKPNTMAKRRRPDFPEQPEPLYDFNIQNGRLVRICCTHYQKYAARRGIGYKICSHACIKTKEPHQMDRVLNNHVWTFDPDPVHALNLFREKAGADLVAAQTAMAKAEDDLREIDAIMKNLDPQDLSEETL